MSLMRKDAPFIFGPEQISAQEGLKAALLASPALQPINYTSAAPVILAIDMLQIAVGFLLCQCNTKNPCICRFAHFGSITLNNHESCFSQLKLELYGLFQVLHSLKAYFIGVRNLVVEVDVRYIKGMLANPNLAPSSSMNHWIISIQLFHFTLIHIPGTQHGPDDHNNLPIKMENPWKTQSLTIGLTKFTGSCISSTHSSRQFNIQNCPQHTSPTPSPTNPHSPTTYSPNLIGPADMPRMQQRSMKPEI